MAALYWIPLNIGNTSIGGDIGGNIGGDIGGNIGGDIGGNMCGDIGGNIGELFFTRYLPSHVAVIVAREVVET